MGLFYNILETYDKCSSVAGIVPVDANGISDEKKAFLPLYHTTFKTNIQVTLDDKGNLLHLDRNQKDLTIIIPCTESSTSRSGKKISAHPLCDQLGYLDKNLNPAKFNNYIQQLENWKADNIKLNSIYEYLTKNSLAEDIKNNNLLKDTEYDSINNTFIKNIDKSGKDKDFVVEKLGIRFSVQIKDDLTPNVWQDSKLKDMWINYCGNFEESSNFDYLGQQLNQLAKTHPKNINSRTANAKLISCNDTSGLTFRGRFNTQDEAVQIDALASQKIHNTLKWLINNYGYYLDSQVIVIWSVDSDTNQKVNPFDNSFGLWSKVESDSDIGIEEVQNLIDIDYSKKVVNLLRGYGNKKWLSEHFRKVVIVIFDAATSGRMGVNFYQELPENEYLENIAKWHEESKWHLTGFKKVINEKGKEEEKPFKYIGCPSFNDITKAVYGKPRALSDKSYITLKKKVKKQLLECMFGNFALPKNYMDMATNRASRPISFVDENGKFKELEWRNSLDIACAITKKYIKQSKKGEIQMELDKTKTDRDYLFGRLLSVADKLESYAFYKQNLSEGQKRATNAIKLMSSFQVKPHQTWGNLWSQLLPYITYLKGTTYFRNIIDEIMELFQDGDYESNKPLSPLYLLGFSAQNRAFKNKENKLEEKNNDIE